jgi:hypothetical protein
MSTPITVSIPHQLGVAEARRRIDEGLAGLIAQTGQGKLAKVDKSWTGDRLAFSVLALGQAVTGHLDVRATAIDMEIHLPGMLGMIAGKIRDRLQKQGQLLLEKK